MNKRFRVPWRLLVGCLMFLFIFSYSVASTAVYANQVSATLDGVRDAGYVLIATDPSGDLAGPGPADWTGTQWTDLTAMYVAADASNLYVYIDLPGYFFNSGDTGNDSSGQIGLAIETDGAVDSGGSGDAWGTAVTFNFTDINGFTTTGALLPDYLVRGNVSNDGG